MIKYIGNTIARKTNNGLFLYTPKNTVDKFLYGMEINTNIGTKPISILMRVDIYCFCDHLLCTMTDTKISRVITKIPTNSHIDNDIKLTIYPGENKIGFISRLSEQTNKNINLLVVKDFNFISRKYVSEKSTTQPLDLFNLKGTQNLTNYIDKIYYINMFERPERRKHIINELMQLYIPKNMVNYVKAVSLSHNPQIGCALSHMKALSDATKNEYETVLILEDDFTFKVNHHMLIDKITLLSNEFPNWDVCMLSSVNYKHNPTGNSQIKRVVKADTTAGYLVRKRAIPLLFNIFYQCTKPKIEYCANQSAIDVAWQVIQPKLNWYIFEPNLGYQSDKFTSDIETFRNVQYKI